MTRPYNNNIKTIYNIFKSVPFKKVKSTDFKLCLQKFSDLDCSITNESEFQQSIDLYKKMIKQLGRLTGYIRIYDD